MADRGLGAALAGALRGARGVQDRKRERREELTDQQTAQQQMMARIMAHEELRRKLQGDRDTGALRTRLAELGVAPQGATLDDLRGQLATVSDERRKGDLKARAAGLIAQNPQAAERAGVALDAPLADEGALAEAGVRIAQAAQELQRFSEFQGFSQQQAQTGISEAEFAQAFLTKYQEPPPGPVLDDFNARSAVFRRERTRAAQEKFLEGSLDNYRAYVQGGGAPNEDLERSLGLSPNDPRVAQVRLLQPDAGFSPKDRQAAVKAAEARAVTGQFLHVSPEERAALEANNNPRAAQQATLLEARRNLRLAKPRTYASMVSQAISGEGLVPMPDLAAEQELVASVAAMQAREQIVALLQRAAEDPQAFVDYGVNPNAVRRAAEARLIEVTVPGVQPAAARCDAGAVGEGSGELDIDALAAAGDTENVLNVVGVGDGPVLEDHEVGDDFVDRL